MKNKVKIEYIPFGKEWEQEVLKWNKQEMVNYIKQICQERNSIENMLNRKVVEWENQRTTISEFQKCFHTIENAINPLKNQY